MPVPSRPRTIDPPARRIIPATDLDGVEVAKQANLYLLTEGRGDVHVDARGLGLYALDSRILSTSVVRINGTVPTLLRGPYATEHGDTIQLTNPELRRNPDDKLAISSTLARSSLSITRSRLIDGELRERLTIVNHSSGVEDLTVELGLGVDMADIFEVRGYPRAARGRLRPIEIEPGRAAFSYDGLDGVRRTTTVVAEDASLDATDDPDAWSGASVVASWSTSLEPGGRMNVGWSVVTTSEAIPPTPSVPPAPEVAPLSPLNRRPASTMDSPPADWPLTTTISSDHELLDRTIARSLADLKMLRNEGPDAGEHYLAAGIPWFTTLFGRDTIIAALETVAFQPANAIMTLEVLARRQAVRDDPWRDAEPGKILHELRTGEMAGAGETPHDPYYGSIDSTPLWLILLAETHAWTGDDELVDRLWPNALAANDWIDAYGDLDGDGFVEYRRRSSRGLLNQGWKDSGDAIRHADGSLAEGSIALAEVQGYVYAARRGLARLAYRRGEREFADRLERAAVQLRADFDSAFWVPEIGFYAMALDGDKRPVATLGSNAGQALWSGIVPPERAAVVADRLLKPDLFSGWGVRSYAAGQVGYNPVGYHTGSIWPHDNALIAAGLKATGSADAANVLAGRLIEAAQWFPDLRLPELFCGFGRDDVGAPVAYPVACSPQAWAAAAPISLITTMLGLRADASAGQLELVHPNLPAWLTRLTVKGLVIGDASVDLLVHSWRGRTSAELIDRRGPIHVLIHA